MNKQTLKEEVRFTGIGVHSGRPASLVLKPSTRGALVFCRADLGGLEIELDPMKAGANNCTFLSRPEGGVRTIEHLLAALRLTGIDSALIEIDAEEVPILDGSARPFVDSFRRSPAQALPDEQRRLTILRPFRLQERDACVSFEPGPDFRVSYAIEFSHPLIGRQELSLVLNPESFAAEIAPARTFGFIKDVEKLRSMGLARGASLENTVVLDDRAVLNPPLRFPDEFVRHKVLDLVGDLSVTGAPLVGHVRAEKAGHSLHLRALQSLLQSPSHWSWSD